MRKSTSKNRPRVLREQAARYVVGAHGQLVAVLLTLEEYDRYLDLLDDQADSRDPKLAARLAQAAARPVRRARHTFQDYVRRRKTPRGRLSQQAPR